MIVFHSKQNGFYPDLKEPLYNVYMCVSFCLPLHRWHATKYFVSNMNSWRMVELISVTEPNRKEQLFHMHALPRCVCVYAINSNEESGHKINIRRSNWRNKKNSLIEQEDRVKETHMRRGYAASVCLQQQYNITDDCICRRRQLLVLINFSKVLATSTHIVKYYTSNGRCSLSLLASPNTLASHYGKLWETMHRIGSCSMVYARQKFIDILSISFN